MKRKKTRRERRGGNVLTPEGLARGLDDFGWLERRIARLPDGSTMARTGWTSRRNPDGFMVSIKATPRPPRLTVRVHEVVSIPWLSTSDACQRRVRAQLLSENCELFGMAWGCHGPNGEVVLDLDHDGPLSEQEFGHKLGRLVDHVERTAPRLRRVIEEANAAPGTVVKD